MNRHVLSSPELQPARPHVYDLMNKSAAEHHLG